MTMSNDYPLDKSPPHPRSQNKYRCICKSNANATYEPICYSPALLLLYFLFSFFRFLCVRRQHDPVNGLGMPSLSIHPCNLPFAQHIHRSSSLFFFLSFFSLLSFNFFFFCPTHPHPSHPLFLLLFSIRTTSVCTCCSSLFLYLYSLVSSLPPALHHFSTLSSLFIS